ncbi:AraC family transcriptional regulator [Bacillus sp. JCM 19041]|uniref:helix-turn-helix transcriptional regulator n=1 Tax=Bacillus sp. JCM 19041 TaxID=1460637 RepID=UPI00336AB211
MKALQDVLLQTKEGIHLYENKHRAKNHIQSHFHYTHQLLYVLEGEGECILDEKPYPLLEDRFIVIRPMTPHSIHARSKMTMLVLQFDETFLPDEYRNELVSPVFAQSEVLQLNAFKGSEIRQLLRKMLYEQLHRQEGQSAIGQKLFLGQILLALVRMKQHSNVQDANDRRAEELKRYIESHYYQLTHAEDLAAKMGISSRYMQQIFKDSYQMTPMQYLTEIRLNRVKHLLVETNLDIVSICFEVGFESVSTFYRVFKNRVGVSPLVYQKTHLDDVVENDL